MDDIQSIANERDSLIQLLGELRVILRTPEDVDVREHARQVTAKAMQAKSRREAELGIGNHVLVEHIQELHAAIGIPADCTGQNAVMYARQVAAKAAKWDAVPWENIDTLIYYASHGYNTDDEVSDLQMWYNANNQPEAA